MRLAIITLAATVAAASTLALSSSAAADKVSPLGAAPPSGTGLPSGQCIRSSEIRNHTVVDNKTMLIDVSGRSTYRVTVSGGCLNGAVSSDPIVTRSPPGANLICKPIQMDLAVSKGGFASQCIVDSIVKLSPEEVASLPPKLRP